MLQHWTFQYDTGLPDNSQAPGKALSVKGLTFYHTQSFGQGCFRKPWLGMESRVWCADGVGACLLISSRLTFHLGGCHRSLLLNLLYGHNEDFTKALNMALHTVTASRGATQESYCGEAQEHASMSQTPMYDGISQANHLHAFDTSTLYWTGHVVQGC